MTQLRLCVLTLGISVVSLCFGWTREWNLSVRHVGGLVAVACRDTKDPKCAIRRVVQELQEWVDSESTAFEPPPCASTETSIEGLWRCYSIFDEGSHVRIAIGQRSSSEITYWSEGHVADYSFSRVAEYRNSEIRLDGPVNPYVRGANLSVFYSPIGRYSLPRSWACRSVH